MRPTVGSGIRRFADLRAENYGLAALADKGGDDRRTGSRSAPRLPVFGRNTWR